MALMDTPSASQVPPFFHPLIRRWFVERYGAPTQVQALAWPKIAAGSHVVVTAPTGTGKTLTAFLFALNQLITGAWQPGSVRMLYVSPLKALNNDVRRNLTAPLAELAAVFAEAGRLGFIEDEGEREPHLVEVCLVFGRARFPNRLPPMWSLP